MDYFHNVIQRLDLDVQGSWLIFSTGAILLLLSLIFSRRLTWREWYLTFGVVGFIGWIGNIVFFFHLDLLDSGAPTIGEVPDIFMFVLFPSSIAILYLNYYSPEERFSYSVVFSAVSVIFEYFLVKVGFLTLKGWRVLYSVPFYWLFYYVFLPFHLQVLRNESVSGGMSIDFRAFFRRKELRIKSPFHRKKRIK